jgi:hypothetical protein
VKRARLERIERSLDRVGRWLFSTWWLWPAGLLAGGALAVTASLVAYPVGNDVHAFGVDLMGPCEFRANTGEPCASCGMTRSWVHLVRGDVGLALRYNVAGVVMWLALVWGGVLGAIRLLRRDRAFLRLPFWVTLPAFAVWGIGIYGGSYVLRVTGFYPLDTVEQDALEQVEDAQDAGAPSMTTSRTQAG